jgi:PAS domain S-box-containing protein
VRTREAQGERERIAAALAAAGTGTFRWDVETDVVEWDDTLGRLFGLSTKSPSRSLESFLSAVHPDDRPSVADMYRRSARMGSSLDMEFRVVWPDGSVHWIDDKARSYGTSNGGHAFVTGACADVTARKRSETALLESERAARDSAQRTSDIKDEFLATLSHELRTPLNAILGWSKILRTGAKDTNDLAKGLEAIERNARAQTQLIEDLLDMSRITSGKLRLDIQPVRPASFIDEAVDTVKTAADTKEIRLEKVLDASVGPISGDPVRLKQVVWNLLSNAIKFTPHGGRVRVTLARADAYIEISVADTGCGVKPEFLPHLFERFRQEDSSSTRHHGGLGLGLSIVKTLVDLHAGTVHASSPGVDQGTTITVRLPSNAPARESVERRHTAATQAVTTSLTPTELEGLTVLVVDDQADARDLIRRVLEDCGATVLTAATADEALRLIEQRRPHVLVTDIGMPGVDGYELLKRVRALGITRGGRLPAIALTAFARSEDRTKALRAGFMVHVAKPVDPSELVATVASVAGRVDGAV